MSRATTHPNALNFLTSPNTPMGVKAQMFQATSLSQELQDAAKADDDLPKCLLDEEGNLRTNTGLLDEKGRFVYDSWQEAAEASFLKDCWRKCE